MCTHCGLTNHTVAECYRKHGYPHGHKLYKSQSSNINNISNVKEKGDNSVQERNQEAENEDVKLTTQQYKDLMALLQQQNTVHNNSHVNQIGTVNKKGSISITCSISKTIKDEWIFDSGATKYVTSFPYLLSYAKR